MEIVNLIQFGKLSSEFGALAITPFFVPITSFITHRRLRANPKTTITLNRDYILAVTPKSGEIKVEWKMVSSITRVRDIICIKVSTKPDRYFWIPVRCFNSPVEADSFFSTAKDYWEHLRFSQELQINSEKLLPSSSFSVDIEHRFRELVLYSYFVSRKTLIFVFIYYAFIAAMFVFRLGAFVAPILCFLPVLALLSPFYVVFQRFRDHPDWLKGKVCITSTHLQSDAPEVGRDDRISWTYVRRVEMWNGAIFLTLNNSSAIIVPCRCFSSTQSADEFYRLAFGYWQKALEQKTRTDLPGKLN